MNVTRSTICKTRKNEQEGKSLDEKLNPSTRKQFLPKQQLLHTVNAVTKTQIQKQQQQQQQQNTKITKHEGRK